MASPAWQRKNLPDLKAKRVALRAFVSSDTMPILKLAAKCGWWSLGKGLLESIAKFVGISNPPAGLFELLLSLTKEVLGIEDNDVLLCLQHRMASMQNDGHKHVDDLMKVDEAAVCLDEADRAEVKRQQKAAHVDERGRPEFNSQYRQRVGRLRSGGNGGDGQAAKRRRVDARFGFKGPRSLPVQPLVGQSDLKHFLPPNSFIWKARS